MVAFSFRLPSASPGLRWRRQFDRLSRRQTGGIPTSIRRRGTTPFRLSPWALGTQHLVRFRCLASPLAASTPLLALDRLILTPRIQIRPGTENIANGTAALELNETGSQNTANGVFAVFNNTIGEQNTALGREALFSNTTGNFNTAIGIMHSTTTRLAATMWSW